jgi:AcrR family transcriptional regulator
LDTSSLYHHFESIDEIIFEAMLMMFNEYTKGIESIEFKDLGDFIKKLGYSTIEMLIQHAEFGKNSAGLWEIILNNDKYIKKINNINTEIVNKISEILFKDINNKKISKEILDNLSLSIYTSLMGMEIAIYMNPDEKLFKNMWNTTSEILLNYLNNEGGNND